MEEDDYEAYGIVHHDSLLPLPSRRSITKRTRIAARTRTSQRSTLNHDMLDTGTHGHFSEEADENNGLNNQDSKSYRKGCSNCGAELPAHPAGKPIQTAVCLKCSQKKAPPFYSLRAAATTGDTMNKNSKDEDEDDESNDEDTMEEDDHLGRSVYAGEGLAGPQPYPNIPPPRRPPQTGTLKRSNREREKKWREGYRERGRMALEAGFDPSIEDLDRLAPHSRNEPVLVIIGIAYEALQKLQQQPQAQATLPTKAGHNSNSSEPETVDYQPQQPPNPSQQHWSRQSLAHETGAVMKLAARKAAFDCERPYRSTPPAARGLPFPFDPSTPSLQPMKEQIQDPKPNGNGGPADGIGTKSGVTHSQSTKTAFTSAPRPSFQSMNDPSMAASGNLTEDWTKTTVPIRTVGTVQLYYTSVRRLREWLHVGLLGMGTRKVLPDGRLDWEWCRVILQLSENPTSRTVALECFKAESHADNDKVVVKGVLLWKVLFARLQPPKISPDGKRFLLRFQNGQGEFLEYLFAGTCSVADWITVFGKYIDRERRTRRSMSNDSKEEEDDDDDEEEDDESNDGENKDEKKDGEAVIFGRTPRCVFRSNEVPPPVPGVFGSTARTPTSHGTTTNFTQTQTSKVSTQPPVRPPAAARITTSQRSTMNQTQTAKVPTFPRQTKAGNIDLDEVSDERGFLKQRPPLQQRQPATEPMKDGRRQSMADQGFEEDEDDLDDVMGPFQKGQQQHDRLYDQRTGRSGRTATNVASMSLRGMPVGTTGAVPDETRHPPPPLAAGQQQARKRRRRQLQQDSDEDCRDGGASGDLEVAAARKNSTGSPPPKTSLSRVRRSLHSGIGGSEFTFGHDCVQEKQQARKNRNVPALGSISSIPSKPSAPNLPAFSSVATSSGHAALSSEPKQGVSASFANSPFPPPTRGVGIQTSASDGIIHRDPNATTPNGVAASSGNTQSPSNHSTDDSMDDFPFDDHGDSPLSPTSACTESTSVLDSSRDDRPTASAMQSSGSSVRYYFWKKVDEEQLPSPFGYLENTTPAMATFVEKAKFEVRLQDLSSFPMTKTAALTDIHIDVNVAVKEGRVTLTDVQIFKELVQQSGFRMKVSTGFKTGKGIVICKELHAPDNYNFRSSRSKSQSDHSQVFIFCGRCGRCDDHPAVHVAQLPQEQVKQLVKAGVIVVMKKKDDLVSKNVLLLYEMVDHTDAIVMKQVEENRQAFLAVTGSQKLKVFNKYFREHCNNKHVEGSRLPPAAYYTTNKLKPIVDAHNNKNQNRLPIKHEDFKVWFDKNDAGARLNQCAWKDRDARIRDLLLYFANLSPEPEWVATAEE